MDDNKTLKKIRLTSGDDVIVDKNDFDYLNQWNWYLSITGYAYRYSWDKDKSKTLSKKDKWKAHKGIYMHRLVNDTPCGFETDHINRNKLDNRKCNLRTVNRRQNTINRGLNKNNTSGYKGIYFDKKTNKWCVEIKNNYKKIWLGRFDNIYNAIKVRKQAELISHKI